MEREKGGRCEQENPQDMAKIMKRHKKTLWKSSEVEMEQQEEEEEEEEKEVVRIKEKKKKKKNRCQGNEKSKHDQKSNNLAMKSARMELEQQQQEEEHEEEMDKIKSKKRKKKNRKTNSNQTEHHQEMDKSHSKKSKKRKSAPQDKLHTMAGPNAVPEEGKGNPGKKFKGEKGVSSLGNVALQIVANASDAAHQSHEEHDRDFELPSRSRKARELIEAASSCAPNNRSESATGSHTVSIAVAGSILENAQSLELATVLAGQIARAAAIFRIDEVVVFDNGHETPKTQMKPRWQGQEAGESAGRLLMRILQYLEIPQYLRRALVPKHTSLCCVGVLPPLDAPHHVRRYEWPPYREGVILDKAVPNGRGSYVDVGLYKEVLIEQSMKAGTRVTVAMGSGRNQIEKGNALKAVECTEPKVLAGLYWGYTVRYAGCLSAVFTECPFKDGYDYCVGTSEHGEKVRSSDLLIPKFKHMLIAFGGLAGLEESVELDSCLKVTGVSSLFDRYLNTCPNQGSRTIRTEEAILISLQFFQDPLQQAIDRSHG